jgi:hypothetical protein
VRFIGGIFFHDGLRVAGASYRMGQSDRSAMTG